jgi:hypothetical protein
LSNKTDDWQSNIIAQSTKKCQSPLDHMLRVMNDKFEDNRRRDAMAKAAAAYMHTKLLAAELKPSMERAYDYTKTPDQLRAEFVQTLVRMGIIAPRVPADVEAVDRSTGVTARQPLRMRRGKQD